MRSSEIIKLNDAFIRPSVRTFNSWDSTRYSQRAVPTIAQTINAPDIFDAGPSLENGTRRPSLAPTVRVDESPPIVNPSPMYTLGWRSYVQIWAALATTTTLTIASFNLYARLHPEN